MSIEDDMNQEADSLLNKVRKPRLKVLQTNVSDEIFIAVCRSADITTHGNRARWVKEACLQRLEREYNTDPTRSFSEDDII